MKNLKKGTQMDNKIIIEKLCHTNVNKYTELSVELTASHLNWNNEKLWFRFPEALSPYLTDRYDPFLAALLPLAMKTKSRLILRGPTSKRLMAQSRQIMKIFSGWYEDLIPIDIQARSIHVNSNKSKAVASFFTCGVDSFYTVLNNMERYENESKISHLIFVHGFDIKINNQYLFDIVKNEITAVAKSLNLDPVFVSTNLRKITDPHTRWLEHQFGAALASVGLCMTSFFRSIYIPSSVAFSDLFSEGSHPIVDPLWSNEHTQFIHDGNEANRYQKVQWQLSKSESAMNYLRVCWKNPDNVYNCGNCAKCLRTKIDLILAGALERCGTLDDDFNIKRYAAIVRENPVERNMLGEIIDSLDDVKKNDEFIEQLKAIYYSSKKHQNSVGVNLKKLINRLFHFF